MQKSYWGYKNMKKIFIVLVIGFIIFSGFGAIALTDDELKQEKITLSFSQLSIQENEEYISLDLEGANSKLMKYNHYIVPTRIETFTFPFGTQIKSIKCQPGNIHRETLTKEIMVAPEPILLEHTNIQKNIKTDSSPIAPSEWYKYNIGTGLNKDDINVFVKVQVFPVQYHPSENIIDWVEQIDIEIEYKESEQPLSSSDVYDYIILSPSEYADELEDLVNHKNNRGIETKLVALNEIYDSQYFLVEGRDNPEKVKYFIKNAIEQWGISSVLLVGGYHSFPARETHVYLEYFDVDESFISDLYYADIYDADGYFASWDTNQNNVFAEYDWGDSHLTDDVDLYPDISIGRIACINETEVKTCVEKITNYETDRASTKDWFTDLVVIGGDTFTDDTWMVDEGEYVNDIVIGILDGFIPKRIWASKGMLDDNVFFNNEISNIINEGCGFVDFSGHGDPNLWATHPHGDESKWLPIPGGYSNIHSAKLTNNEKLPIIVLGACSTCKYNVIDNCFGWSFLSNPNGGGIGSFGVTTFGYANGGGRGITGGFIEEITMNIFEAYKECVNKGDSITFGEMWVMAIEDYIYPSMEVRDYATLESWQSFGDPTLVIGEHSQVPEKPAKPSGQSSVEPDILYSYSSSTTDPDGDDLYYLFNWGDDNLSGWIGPYNSGEQVEANHSWANKGRYQVKAKAKDENGVQSDWSDPLTVSMPKSIEFENIGLLKLLYRFWGKSQFFNFFKIILEFKI